MTQQEKNRWIAFGNQTNPFDLHNGIEITDVDEGMAVVTVTLRQESLNSWHTPHGGLLFAAADVACGVAAVSLRAEQCVTVNAAADFIAVAGACGTLTVTARAEHAGRHLCFCRADVHDEQHRLIARLHSTMYYTGALLE